MACAKTCLRKHYYQYELGIRRDRDSQPLRMGSVFHEGLDALAQGRSLDDAAAIVYYHYATEPTWIQSDEDRFDWQVECETVVRLVCGYAWRWSNDGLDVVATEQAFDLPLINPDTGRPSTHWRIGGKIDKIIRLADGRLAVMEHKTTSDDLGPDSDYWRRLRLDQQISLYMLAARQLGYDVQTVVYDVCRKPQIGPLSVPLLDEHGAKIVLDANGQRVYKKDGSPRQSGDAANGFVLQSRRQTAAEFGERLNGDIASRPDWYFARMEIPRLDADIEEFRVELWQIQTQLRESQRRGCWFRNTGACISPYRCEYLDVCSQSIDPASEVPQGFIRVDNVHPELAMKGE